MVSSKDSTGNITASFGADFFQQGATSIPNLLLKYYKKVGLTDMEMILIIHLLRFKCEENNPFPTMESLKGYLASEELLIKGTVAGLIEKELLTIVHYYDEQNGEVLNAYSYDNIFEKISEIWAQDKMQELQRTRRAVRRNQDKFIKNNVGLNLEKEFIAVHKSFEREFGRLLSPMEIEQIQAWLSVDGHNPEIILEALRRAVLMGKHNFKYIDKILLEWKKNNVLTINEIDTYDNGFRQRQVTKTVKPTNPTNPTKDSNHKKDKIKLLYNL